MLEAFIIGEVMRRESEEARWRELERPALQIPMLEPGTAQQRREREEEHPGRGILIIEPMAEPESDMPPAPKPPATTPPAS